MDKTLQSFHETSIVSGFVKFNRATNQSKLAEICGIWLDKDLTPFNGTFEHCYYSLGNRNFYIHFSYHMDPTEDRKQVEKAMRAQSIIAGPGKMLDIYVSESTTFVNVKVSMKLQVL